MKKILVIDDDGMVRSTIARILEDAGYQVVLADDGRTGITAFRAQNPDLVITDIIMPQQEGIATIRAMLAERPGTKIVAISGGGRRGNPDFLEIAKKFGAIGTLRKPFLPQALVDLVARCLEVT